MILELYFWEKDNVDYRKKQFTIIIIKNNHFKFFDV